VFLCPNFILRCLL